MINKLPPLFALLTLLLVPTSGLSQVSNFGKSKLNMVASVHPLATKAGIKAFEKGGNAIDAAIATAVTLGVVDGYNSGLGGGCFVLIRRADGSIVAIDGREMAPAASHRDMFVEQGRADTDASQIGPLAIGIPGALKAYDQAIREHGRLELRDVMLPAAEIADNGFAISKLYSDKINHVARHLKKFPAAAKILLNPDQTIRQPGDILKQKDLANTYRQIANHGIEWFYEGKFAIEINDWMRKNDGIITRQDFQNYTTKIREPIISDYRGYKIVGFPPPSSGGVHVAQILNILEWFDLKQLHREDPIRMNHLVVEAMKLAFADRAYWLGDSDYVNVPKQLVSKEYAKSLASKIDLTKAVEVRTHGTPPRADSEFFEKHTTHLTAADKEGNWVAITTTNNTWFGSKVIVPGLGVFMNNQMDDFSIKPGVPNAYGLIGSEQNAIAPGKRPLSSMSPTIVFKDDQPILTVGAAGGPKIITQVVWAIINHLDLKMSVQDAISQARIHHQWSPDLLYVEESIHANMREQLEKYGHQLRENSRDKSGVSQAIGFDPATGEFVGAHDPRVPGLAAGQ